MYVVKSKKEHERGFYYYYYYYKCAKFGIMTSFLQHLLQVLIVVTVNFVKGHFLAHDVSRSHNRMTEAEHSKWPQKKSVI